MTNVHNSKPNTVAVSAEGSACKTMRKGTLVEFLLASPLRGADLDLERQRDFPRDLPCLLTAAQPVGPGK